MTTSQRLMNGMLTLMVMAAAAASTFAQQAVTRVEGFVRNEVTNTPVGVKIYVYQPDGKRLSISSNSSDGSYLVVLNSAGAHRFVMAGHNVYKKEYTIEVPKSQKFQEIKKDFTVQELREGEQLASVVGFNTNGAVITGQGKQVLDKLKEDLNVNQQMNVVITVVADQDQLTGLAEAQRAQYLKDSTAWAKSMKAYEKKYKKAKTKPEPPVAPVAPTSAPADPNIALLQQRIQAVHAEMKDVKNGDLRVVVKSAPLPASATAAAAPATAAVDESSSKKSKSKKSKAKKAPAAAAKSAQPVGPKHSTLVVNIGPVKRLFGE